MKKLILIFLFLILVSLAYANSGDMHELANEYMKEFEKGMTLNEVRRIILKQGSNGKFYNNCTEKYQYPMDACSKGYILIENIKLPGHDRTKGNISLQMYFALNKDQILTDIFHELYDDDEER